MDTGFDAPAAPAVDNRPGVDIRDEQPQLWCPVCDQRLEQRKCKLFCGRCGYYMSCADYI
ncbi:MAG: hypothetical protein FJW40_08090 [Acidobacteria bacterium]|nr:hypothetical protein [Acidobacteriota bacterium]